MRELINLVEARKTPFRLSKRLFDAAVEELTDPSTSEGEHYDAAREDYGGEYGDVPKSHRPSFEKWFRKQAKSMIANAWAKIEPRIEDNHIRCWRALTAPLDWKPTSRTVGRYWSWDKDCATPVHGVYDSDHVEWRVEALVPVQSIDWVETLVQNCHPNWGEDENEITVNQSEDAGGMPVKIVKAEIVNRLRVDDPNRPPSSAEREEMAQRAAIQRAKEHEETVASLEHDVSLDAVIRACKTNPSLLGRYANKIGLSGVNAVLDVVPQAIGSLAGTKFMRDPQKKRAAKNLWYQHIRDLIPQPWPEEVTQRFWESYIEHGRDLRAVPEKYRHLMHNAMISRLINDKSLFQTYEDLITPEIALHMVAIWHDYFDLIPQRILNSPAAVQIAFRAYKYFRFLGDKIMKRVPSQYWPRNLIGDLAMEDKLADFDDVPERLRDRPEIIFWFIQHNPHSLNRFSHDDIARARAWANERPDWALPKNAWTRVAA